ncbi:MAG TPA: PEGA domain-containing protein [Candidatus Saccharimonadales bacterium]|nr:PEGA domain-containing protein [Candidatus Saccharimonadales bacterium]
MKKIVVISLLTLVAIVLVYLFFEYALPTLSPNNASLSVNVSGESAKIYLNNKEIGKTPYYSAKQKIGDYDLEVRRGTTKWVTKVTLTSHTLTMLEVDLSKENLFTSANNLSFKSGERSLLVLTKPDKTKVFLDEHSKGTSPQKLSPSAGVSSLKIAKDGYLTREVPVSIEEDHTSTALIYLSADPFGVTKKLDGNAKVTLFGFYNSFIDLSRDYSSWAEGVDHTQISFSSNETHFDALVDPNGKVYPLNPTQWQNKLSSKADANVGYLSKDANYTLTASAKSSWESLKSKFN